MNCGRDCPPDDAALVISDSASYKAIPRPRTRNPEPETLNPKPTTRNPEPETLNPGPGTRNPSTHETPTSKPKTVSKETESVDPNLKLLKQGTFTFTAMRHQQGRRLLT